MSEPMTNNKFTPWPMTEPAYTEQDKLRNLLGALVQDCAKEGAVEFEHTLACAAKALEIHIDRVRHEAIAGAVEACAKHRPYWKGLALVCACGKWTYASYTDKEGTKVQEQWEAHIRTLYPAATGELERRLAEARAGMREACAKHCQTILESRDPDDARGIAAANLCAMGVESLPDLAAGEAIERIKREARLEEAQWFKGLFMTESDIQETERHIQERIAALSGKEPSHDQAKI